MSSIGALEKNDHTELKQELNSTDSQHQQQQQQQSYQLRRRSQRLRDKTCINYNIEELIHQQDKYIEQQKQLERLQKKIMLSKIKSSNVETRGQAAISTSFNSGQNLSDNEITDGVDSNDSNNNDSKSMNNNPSTKKSQNELIDIVEISRKRRLSKDSADSLTNFIKWSFGHLDQSGIAQRDKSNFSLADFKASLLHQGFNDDNNNNNNNDNINNNNNNNGGKDNNLVARMSQQEQQDLILDDEDDWSTLQHHGLMRNNEKLSALTGSCGGSSAANLALLRNHQDRSNDSGGFGRNNKRLRSHIYSPDLKFTSSSTSAAGVAAGNSVGKKGYLGNVVDRLHQQQKQQQQQQAFSSLELDDESSPNTGLSYHLQQFLQQQTSLEDLCSSVGLDESNQLVLAAAIHRALVDSVGGDGKLTSGGDNKSTSSSTGSSSGVSSSTNINNASSANLHQVDLMGRRARLHKATLHGLVAAAAASQNQQSQPQVNHQLKLSQQNNAMNMSNRVQQQRHAQAAAALSALASAGSHYTSSNSGHNHQQQLAATNNSISTGANGTSSSSGVGAGLSVGGGPVVDFECDTCGSSFDDRHRLMQHQSIHLELKKDWFNETPVDEVMKIFNRRRGEFLCNTCNLRFEATFDYDKHNHSVHGQRPYCCQFCGNGTRTFRFWRQYLNHLYDHRYIFSCTIDDCDFTVNRRDSLRFHIFRFHLNCQLPQQQQQIRSSHNHNNNNLLLNESKWSTLEEDDDIDELMTVGE